MIAFRQIPARECQRGPVACLTPPASTVDRMAETMRELAFAHRNVERASLFLEGFSLAEIDAHWQAAASLARQRAVRRVGEAA
ncbi:MAG: hypothetical protein MEQ84_07700 [Mesorhizobium sp.]|nr:hypothetical protein [Mesorhizobium sp.]